MAAIVNARDALLQAAAVRYVTPALLGTIDFASVTGATRPADNATQNTITYAAAAPASPGNGDIWVDTSVTPNVTRVRVAGAWQVGANLTTNTNQLADGANLGGTAAWSGVSGTNGAVDTIHLASNAATIPASAAGASYNLSTTPGNAVSVNVAAPTGTPIQVTIAGIGVCQFSSLATGFDIYYEIVRDGSTVLWYGWSHELVNTISTASYPLSIPLAATVIDTAPDSASHTYALRARYRGTPGGSPTMYIQNPVITVLAVKR
jgi:hypothetical protein